MVSTFSSIVPGLIACEGEFAHILASLALVVVTVLPDNFRTVDLEHEDPLPVRRLAHRAIFFVRGNRGRVGRDTYKNLQFLSKDAGLPSFVHRCQLLPRRRHLCRRSETPFLTADGAKSVSGPDQVIGR